MNTTRYPAILAAAGFSAAAPTGWRVLGAVTPVGGIAFLAGWIALGWAVRGSTTVLSKTRN